MNGDQMAAEMAEQPEVLRVLATRAAHDRDRVAAVVPSPLAGVALVARGSSDNAAVLGRYAIEYACGRPASLAAASLHTRYHCPADYSGYLVVALSQSGRTPEIVSTCELLRAAGASVVAIVNDADSPLAAASDVVLDVAAGVELAVPATKTVTAQMALVIVVAAALSAERIDLSSLSGLHDAVAGLLADAHPVEELAERWRQHERLVVAARGFCLSAALETALKCKETALLFAEGFSSADLLHGPIAAVSSDVPSLVIDGGGATSADTNELIDRLQKAGAPVATVSAAPHATVSIPAALPELLRPIAATVRGQQFALFASRVRGLDPDQPAGLSKVTLTY